MAISRRACHRILTGVLVTVAGLAYGCGNLNIQCDGAGKGYSCTHVDGPPERHTRSQYQPSWADEYHDIGTEQPTVSEHVFEITNQTRQREGLSALRHDRMLSQIACWHNQVMLGHNYLGHNDSDDRMPWDRVPTEHRRLIGPVQENAYDGGGLGNRDKRQWGAAIVDSWMGSSGHRENIMSSKWTHLGVCVSTDSRDGRATQVFAQVWAYLDEPLPWTVTPGESASGSFTLVKADHSPTRYAFAPVDEPMWETFSTRSSGHAANGTLFFPDSTGTYELRVRIPDGSGGHETLGGPRVKVKKEGEPAY